MADGADGLIAAYLMDGRGGGQGVGWETVRTWTPERGLLWVHLDYTAPRARQWLVEDSGLNELVADALLAEDTRPRSAWTDSGLLITLRGVNTNPGQTPEDMVAVRIWLEAGRIVSARKRRLLSLQDVRDALERGRGPRTAGEFLVEVAGRLAARMHEVIDRIEEAVDELEDAVTTAKSHEVRPALATVRRRAIMLRRYLAPQRDVLARLHTERVPLFSEVDRLQLRETADTVTRYVEELDEARERATVTSEELVSRQAEQLNTRMYLLSMIAAVFLPLGFVTGLLGVNVGGIPGAENPLAFVLVAGLLVAFGLLELVVFHWKKWF